MLTGKAAKKKKKLFEYIGIVGHPRHPEALATHEQLYNWLRAQKYKVIIEKKLHNNLT